MARFKLIKKTPSTTLWAMSLVLVSSVLTACSPGFQSSNKFVETPNQTTGYIALDGKQHTGAGNDQELQKVKAEVLGKNVPAAEAAQTTVLQAVANDTIESLSKTDRRFAMRILSARVTTGTRSDIDLHAMIREIGKVTFSFGPKQIAPKAATDGPNDVRFESVVGKTEHGETTTLSASMLCRKPAPVEGKTPYTACRVATVRMKDSYGDGATAGVVVRNQETLVMSKTTTALKHDVLKRLFTNFRTAQPGLLQSFEVAWGASGFALAMGDAEICPVGRLVETNDLDEPLKLNCTGVPEFRDLEGRMVGNSTHGEIFLEIAATIPGLLWGESNERIFLYVRQKRDVKKPVTAPTTQTPAQPTQPNSPAAPGPKPGTPSGPAVPAPTQPSAQPGQLEDDDSDLEDGEPVFDTEIKADMTPTAPSKTAGWLIPINFNDPITKTWARDRKNPVIDKGVELWKSNKRSGDIGGFATYYPPNQKLVTQKLGESHIPAEFAFITLMESSFFKKAGYSIDRGPGSTAFGPWQMIAGTAIGNGLRIFPGKAKSKICDERADLAKSTAAAGRYLRTLVNMFPYDPKIAVLAYNRGEGHALSSVNRLKKSPSEARLAAIREMGLSFWAIRKFNMANINGIKYVETFVSIYHATLEMPPVAPKVNAAAWQTPAQCR